MSAGQSAVELIRQAEELSRAAQFPEAAATYLRLLSLRPDLADSWYNLALIQRRLGRFDEALASYQQALVRGIRQPEEVRLNRGVIYADDLRRDAEAERELRAALALNPRYIPAYLNLANLKEGRGDRAVALELYARALALDPNCHEALARTAILASTTTKDDPIVVRLKHAIADPRTTAAAKATLGFALAKVLDQGGDFDGAFEACVAANRDSRLSAGPSAPRYERSSHEHLIDEVIAAFSARETAAATIAAKPPIFICGMFRSGSTLVEQVLASHPRVTAGGEIHALPALVHGHLTPFPASMVGTTSAKLSELGRHYLDHVAKLFPTADIVTDKRPDNFLYIGLIKRLFPNAKIIHTTRDPLDNCLSVFFLHLDHSMSYALDLGDAGHYYRQYRRLMAHWKQRFAGDIFDFDYDAFVRNPRPSIENLLAFLGLEWNDACLSFHETATLVKTASVWQVREPLYSRSSGRWRNYERHLEPLRVELKDDIVPSPAR